MLRQEPPGGAIVNTSSVNGLGGALQGSLYSATKAGVLALTKSAEQEYARSGVRANALVAGAFRTPMLEGVFEKASEGVPGGPGEAEERYATMVPAGRIGTPEEAAGGVAVLRGGLLRHRPLHDRGRRLDGRDALGASRAGQASTRGATHRATGH